MKRKVGKTGWPLAFSLPRAEGVYEAGCRIPAWKGFVWGRRRVFGNYCGPLRVYIPKGARFVIPHKRARWRRSFARKFRTEALLFPHKRRPGLRGPLASAYPYRWKRGMNWADGLNLSIYAECAEGFHFCSSKRGAAYWART